MWIVVDINYLCVCIHMYVCGLTCLGTHVEDKGQLMGVHSPVLPCELQGLNSGHQTW